MGIASLARQIFEEQSFDDQEFITLHEILVASDKLYHNDEEPFLTDTEYDVLRRFAEKLNPSHVYFTGVGSEVRGGKIKLPFKLGSLDQVYEGEIRKWVAKHELEAGCFVVLTDKLDGASAMLVYGEDGNLQIGYSRGNGLEGADWTRHLKLLDTVPENVGKAMVVRGEVIIEKGSFSYLKSQVKTRAGKEYKNLRNMVSGMMNASTNNEIVYNYIRFIAYQVVDGEGSKQEQLSELDNLGFSVVHSLCVFSKELNDESLTDHLNLRRQNSIFEIDGLVIDVDDAEKRAEMNPTTDSLNPEYAIKYKVAAADNIAYPTCVGVEYNLSTTISWLTGFNAKFILDNNIGKGTVLEITKAGDVIPLIQDIITSTVAEMPDGEWEWTVNDQGVKVDAKVSNPEDFSEIAVKRITSFFTKIEAPLLKEGSVLSLYSAGFSSVCAIIKAEEYDLIHVLGKNGKKIFKGLHDKLNDIPYYKLVGAYSTQRGIGIRKIKKIQMWYDKQGIDLRENAHTKLISTIDGYDVKSAEAAFNAIVEFEDLFDSIEEFITLNKDSLVSSAGGSLDNHKICMTGFRDKELSEKIEKAGGTVQSSVSGKTTILITKDPTSTTGKAKKAREMGIPVMGIDEFKQEYK